MFVDTAVVFVRAGKGGDGVVSFRHEKFVDKGGPDGGDGGRGGDVVFEASDNVNTLADFRMRQELKASNGQSGGKRKMHGGNGDDLLVKVPVGTVVQRDGVTIADLVENGQQAVVARGGDGGFGNAHFKSSTRQAPRVAELGEKGDEFEAVLELKLLADVGLVGFPNAGKSTFLSVVTNAKPEIADYEFTTLTPNLGVADVDGTSLLLADIPGLIEGASEGKGLGDAFLKHIERTAVILHFVDAYREDPREAYLTIRRELEQYSPILTELPEVVALTKVEGFDPELLDMQKAALAEALPPGQSVFAVSSSAGVGLTELLRELARVVRDARQREAVAIAEEQDDIPTISLSDAETAEGWSVEKTDKVFVVTGEKIEKFARRTDMGNIHSLNRLRDIMRKTGIVHELIRQGADGTSLVRVGEREFTLTEEISA